ncbi:ABC transporter permease DevC [Thermosynechococcus sp. B0]|uniref:ABC transporter permease DevC n=1 Tax=unclassified Thermosynechococcus TaxID=2622553 RepID=UPI0025758D87|nr:MULTISPECIES: ABC transporter permease DevC [unclassified Thermosynechococcus]WJI23574.1 ABC transporter permease DevC [Thermosynechococcus sp. B0]WJI26089.1 ABC transporter permease DevC [Thermosynechococcus sp. B1]WJI28616.1 ABC transporter permease DevC [Thermosynechococcus sp. B3]
MIFAIPLAWLQLIRERIRLLVAIAGIAFAVVLMLMQFGFRDALFKAAVRFHESLNTDIVLISPQSTALIAMRSFPRRRLYQAAGFEGVESVSPLYLSFGLWRNPINKSTRQLMVIGVDPLAVSISVSDTPHWQEAIKLADHVLFDAQSRTEFGPIPELYRQGEEVTTEVSGRKITVAGLFRMGANFGADGNLLTSDLNFLRLFPERHPGLIDVGLVRVQPGVNTKALARRMNASLGNDVLVMTREEFAEFERSYWEKSTSIGFIFSLGALMGFIVGSVIVYQILYTDVTDHLAEYATLKAMGYRDIFFYGVVMQESLILSCMGYVPGFIVSFLLYILIARATSLPVWMTVERASLVFTLTVLMCTLSGAIAMRRIQAADPADIF